MPITEYEGEGSSGSEVAMGHWLAIPAETGLYSSSLCLALYCVILSNQTYVCKKIFVGLYDYIYPKQCSQDLCYLLEVQILVI
jgi:hypothetical protein